MKLTEEHLCLMRAVVNARDRLRILAGSVSSPDLRTALGQVGVMLTAGLKARMHRQAGRSDEVVPGNR
jgi:hypothetical protein